MTGKLMVPGLALVSVVLGACGSGAAAELERGPNERIDVLLSQAPDSGATLMLTAGDTLRISPQTLSFYRLQGFSSAWVDEGTDRAREVHAAIGHAEEDGLTPSRYGYDVAGRLLDLLEAEGDEELDDGARGAYLADLDLVLSEGYLRYVTDVVRGAIEPESVGRAWRIPRSDPPDERVLRAVARGGDPVEMVQRLRPNTPYYGRMMTALGRLREIRDAGGWQRLPADLAVTEGDSAAGVQALRSRLLASDDRREAELAQSGAARPAYFDGDLREAVRAFQSRHAIEDDGRLGKATLRELNHDIEERIAEVKLNMDRWRWLPRDLGDLFILVNIAGFELEVVENHRAIEAMNVVVGQAGWHTPVFADTLEHVVVNPYWNPPPSILEQEILPAVARDPGYLARNDFERTSDGRIRQRPGSKNALGKYKFMFPNDDNIYLHDTPAGHLFSRTRRDFSHGCVRLERPEDLARLLLAKATSQSPASLDAMVAAGSEKWVTLKRPIPIYIVYFTAWVKEDGTLRFHHDVYGHDEDLEMQKQELHGDSAAVPRVAGA
jgi:L,D-transpeptidase YcbB